MLANGMEAGQQRSRISGKHCYCGDQQLCSHQRSVYLHTTNTFWNAAFFPEGPAAGAGLRGCRTQQQAGENGLLPSCCCCCWTGAWLAWRESSRCIMEAAPQLQLADACCVAAGVAAGSRRLRRLLSDQPGSCTGKQLRRSQTVCELCRLKPSNIDSSSTK